MAPSLEHRYAAARLASATLTAAPAQRAATYDDYPGVAAPRHRPARSLRYVNPRPALEARPGGDYAGEELALRSGAAWPRRSGRLASPGRAGEIHRPRDVVVPDLASWRRASECRRCRSTRPTSCSPGLGARSRRARRRSIAGTKLEGVRGVQRRPTWFVDPEARTLEILERDSQGLSPLRGVLRRCEGARRAVRRHRARARLWRDSARPVIPDATSGQPHFCGHFFPHWSIVRLHCGSPPCSSRCCSTSPRHFGCRCPRIARAGVERDPPPDRSDAAGEALLRVWVSSARSWCPSCRSSVLSVLLPPLLAFAVVVAVVVELVGAALRLGRTRSLSSSSPRALGWASVPGSW